MKIDCIEKKKNTAATISKHRMRKILQPAKNIMLARPE